MSQVGTKELESENKEPNLSNKAFISTAIIFSSLIVSALLGSARLGSTDQEGEKVTEMTWRGSGSSLERIFPPSEFRLAVTDNVCRRRLLRSAGRTMDEEIAQR